MKLLSTLQSKQYCRESYNCEIEKKNVFLFSYTKYFYLTKSSSTIDTERRLDIFCGSENVTFSVGNL